MDQISPSPRTVKITHIDKSPVGVSEQIYPNVLLLVEDCRIKMTELETVKIQLKDASPLLCGLVKIAAGCIADHTGNSGYGNSEELNSEFALSVPEFEDVMMDERILELVDTGLLSGGYRRLEACLALCSKMRTPYKPRRVMASTALVGFIDRIEKAIGHLDSDPHYLLDARLALEESVTFEECSVAHSASVNLILGNVTTLESLGLDGVTIPNYSDYVLDMAEAVGITIVEYYRLTPMRGVYRPMPNKREVNFGNIRFTVSLAVLMAVEHHLLKTHEPTDELAAEILATSSLAGDKHFVPTVQALALMIPKLKVNLEKVRSMTKENNATSKFAPTDAVAPEMGCLTSLGTTLLTAAYSLRLTPSVATVEPKAMLTRALLDDNLQRAVDDAKLNVMADYIRSVTGMVLNISTVADMAVGELPMTMYKAIAKGRPEHTESIGEGAFIAVMVSYINLAVTVNESHVRSVADILEELGYCYGDTILKQPTA